MADKLKSDQTQARKAAALRANLRKRKAAARKAKSLAGPSANDKRA